MLSPTGGLIRHDQEGSGFYGASRGKRRHNGIDYKCEKGQDIVAPFGMTLTRIAYANRDMRMRRSCFTSNLLKN